MSRRTNDSNEVDCEMEEGERENAAAAAAADSTIEVMTHLHTTTAAMASTSPPPPRQFRQQRNAVAAVVAIILLVVVALAVGTGLSLFYKDSERRQESIQSSDSQVTVFGDGNDDAGTASSVSNSSNSSAAVANLTSSSSSSSVVTNQTISNFTSSNFTIGTNFSGSNPTNSTKPDTATPGPCDKLHEQIRAKARLVGQLAVESVYSSFVDDTLEGGGGGETGDDAFLVDVETANSGSRRRLRQKRRWQREASSTGTAAAVVVPEVASWSTYSQHQHVGVNEMDFVQCNGVDIFIYFGVELVVINSTTLAVSKRIAIPQDDRYGSDQVKGMLLVDNRLLVFKQEFETVLTAFSYIENPTHTTVLIFDTSTMDQLKTVTLPGSFTTAVAVGSIVYAVSGTELASDSLLDRLYSDNFQDQDAESYRQQALAWLEVELDYMAKNATKHVDCTKALMQWSDKIFSNEIQTNFTSLTSISSFNMSALSSSSSKSSSSMTPNTSTFFLPRDYLEVYASPSHLILLGRSYSPYNSDTLMEPKSYVFPFELSGASAEPLSTGILAGEASLRSGLDTIQQGGKDYLRLFTQIGASDFIYSYDDYYPSGAPWSLQLTILEMTKKVDTVMPVVGTWATEGKPGATGFATLFDGDRAFVSMANDTNSFHALNISNPANPRHMATVDGLGYSTLLHNAGDNLIFSVSGQSADLIDVSYAVNFRLSLFDLSSLTSPRLVSQWQDRPPKDKNTSESVLSDVEFDTKSFRYLYDKQIAILPMTVIKYLHCSELESDDGNLGSWSDDFCEWGPSFDGFRLFQINATADIVPYLSVEHDAFDSPCGLYGDESSDARSMVLANGDLVTMMGGTMQSHDLETGTKVVPSLFLAEGSNCTVIY